MTKPVCERFLVLEKGKIAAGCENVKGMTKGLG